MTQHNLLPPPVPLTSKMGFERLVNSTFVWPLVLVVEVLIYSSYSIFLNLSRIDGEVSYSPASTVLIIELIKFMLTVGIARQELLSDDMSKLQLKNIIPFMVPAVCYCFNNNLAVYMQDQMDPATFQVLCNLKIASTAVLYRLIMRRKLQNVQWLSLLLLTVAGGLNSYSGLSKKIVSQTEIHITVIGLLMALLYCTISGFSGVYTEYIFKRDFKISLHLQNCFLYAFGVLLNSTLWIVQTDNYNFFRGYNSFTWAAILCQAMNGLIMSVIMKHSNNIVRLFIISSAIPVTTVLSMTILELKPDNLFFFVVALVLLAIILYNLKSLRR